MKKIIAAVLMIAIIGAAVAWAQAPQGPQGPRPPKQQAGPPPGAPGQPGMNPAPGMAPPGVMGGQGGMRQGPGGGLGASPLMIVRVPPPQYFDMMQEQLGLSEDQKAKVKTALDKYTEKNKPLMEQYSQASKALSDTMSAPKFDSAKAKSAATKATESESALINNALTFWTDYRGILTTEQNEKISQMLPLGTRGMMFGPRVGGPQMMPQGGPGVPPPPGSVPPPPAPNLGPPPAPGQ